MEKSASIQNIAKALITFHEHCDTIAKGSNNPFFKSKYASLSNIQEAIKEPLNKSGLAYSQLPDGENGLVTILMHSGSGEFLESCYNMKPVKDDPQGRGSCITYQKRYALAAILGLQIDDDDDGNAASQPPRKNSNSAPQQKQPDYVERKMEQHIENTEPKATEAQKKTIINLIADSCITEDEYKKMFASIPDLTEARAKQAIGKLQKTIAERKAVTA